MRGRCLAQRAAWAAARPARPPAPAHGSREGLGRRRVGSVRGRAGGEVQWDSPPPLGVIRDADDGVWPPLDAAAWVVRSGSPPHGQAAAARASEQQ